MTRFWLKIGLAVVGLLFGLILLFKDSRKSKVSKGEVITALSNQSQLATVEYSLGKAVKYEGTNLFFGKKAALFETRWHVLAGIDLSELKEENIRIKGKRINVTLPPSKIISLAIDNDFTREVYSNSNWLALDLSPDEKAELLEKGEIAVKAQVMESEILRDASALASEQIAAWLLTLGFEHVTIEFEGAESPAIIRKIPGT